MLPPPDYMPALITPFTRGGEIDTRAHTTNLRLLAAPVSTVSSSVGRTGKGRIWSLVSDSGW